MRKYIALVLALVCVLGLVGCSANTVDKEKPVFEVDREKPIFETENILFIRFREAKMKRMAPICKLSI